VPPCDPAALAEGLERMVSKSIAEREELGIKARERVEKEYTIECARNRYEKLYLSLSEGLVVEKKGLE
jgi:glycosyltransferase involved in cell wall biosynthesis